MLSTARVMATVAVRDLAKARAFYEQKLGLEAESTMGEEAVSYKASGSSLIVYRSEFAGGNRATVATWYLGEEFERTMKDLASRGVAFEHYDQMKGTERVGDFYSAGARKMAWFKDPDGNVHGLMTE